MPAGIVRRRRRRGSRQITVTRPLWDDRKIFDGVSADGLSLLVHRGMWVVAPWGL